MAQRTREPERRERVERRADRRCEYCRAPRNALRTPAQLVPALRLFADNSTVRLPRRLLYTYIRHYENMDRMSRCTKLGDWRRRRAHR